MRNIFVKLFLKLGHWFGRQCNLKVFSSGGHFVQPSSLCKFGKEHYEEHFSEVILNLDLSLYYFRRFFSIFSSGGHFVQQNGMFVQF